MTTCLPSKAWDRGALLIAHECAEAPANLPALLKNASSFDYDAGVNTTEISVTTACSAVGGSGSANVTRNVPVQRTPSLSFEYYPTQGEGRLSDILRCQEDNRCGAAFYFYFDCENDPTNYIYGYALVSGVNASGNPNDPIQGSFELMPDARGEWSEDFATF